MPTKKKAKETKTKVVKVPLRVSMSDWETEGSLLLLRGWKRDGFQDKEIAQKIGVTPKTICEWKSRSELIREALKKSREEWHRDLEEAMYRRATGYMVDEWVEEYKYDENGTPTLVTKRINHKHVAPSETMQIFVSKHDIRGHWLDDKTEADAEEQKKRIEKLKREAEKTDEPTALKITIEGGDGYAD